MRARKGQPCLGITVSQQSQCPAVSQHDQTPCRCSSEQHRYHVLSYTARVMCNPGDGVWRPEYLTSHGSLWAKRHLELRPEEWGGVGKAERGNNVWEEGEMEAE